MATLAPSLARSLLATSLIAFGGCARAASPDDPARILEELLTADRDFAAASARTTAAEGLTPMFAADVEMRAPAGMIRGRDAAVAELGNAPDNQGGRLEWRPIRGGLSADGRHGFTYGYMTLTKADSSVVPLKYLAYWVREPEGWRVKVYRRGRRPEGPVADSMLPPALPAAIVPMSSDSARIAEYARSLDGAERAFSARAGVVGVGPAFKEFGSPDAMNMGGPADTGFVLGADAIGNAVGAGQPPGPAAITWGPDRVLVASSGDLGVTIGFIEIPSGSEAPARRIPFFTIWRRASPADPWRYVAE